MPVSFWSLVDSCLNGNHTTSSFFYIVCTFVFNPGITACMCIVREYYESSFGNMVYRSVIQEKNSN